MEPADYIKDFGDPELTDHIKRIRATRAQIAIELSKRSMTSPAQVASNRTRSTPSAATHCEGGAVTLQEDQQ